MLSKKIIYSITIGIIIIICISGMAPKQNQELKTILGIAIENIPSKLQYIPKEQGIYLEKNDQREITSIKILKKGYTLHGIAIGDSLSKIRSIFNQDIIEEDNHHVKINRGKTNHFGIVTEQLIFIFDKYQRVQEMRLGYTTSFMDKELLKSNEEVYEVLNGEWISEDERVLKFRDGQLSDSILDSLWDRQYYQVLQPTEILITRMKDEATEKVKMNFWIAESKLYLYAIDVQGVPITESIETFIKQKE
ncbi:MAG: hypothetical protein ACRCWY_04270 [Cellulosilyticaceae bacterium]